MFNNFLMRMRSLLCHPKSERDRSRWPRMLFALGRISQIFPMRNPTKADAMEPSSDPILANNRIWFSSREPDIHEVVNPSDLTDRVNRPPKKPTVIDRLGKLVAGRTAIFKIKIKNNLGGFVMPLRNESTRAQARLQLETPISDDASLHKLQSKSQTMFVKRSTVTRQNLMS